MEHPSAGQASAVLQSTGEEVVLHEGAKNNIHRST